MTVISPKAKIQEVETLFTGDNLPSHWQLLALKQVTKPSSAKVDPTSHPDAPYLSLEHIEANTTKIVGQGQGKDVRSTKAAFRAGDVLYGKLRPYLNKVTIPDFDGIASTDMLVFPPNDKLDQRYLMRFLNSATVVEYAHHHSMGLQMPRIGFDVLGEIEIPVPPISEQKAIADLIDRLAEQVNSARDRLAAIPILLKRFRQSVLAAACSGQLTADWRERHLNVEPNPSEPLAAKRCDTSGAPNTDELMDATPQTWRFWSIAGAAERLIDYRGRTPPTADEGIIPHVRTSNIRSGTVDFNTSSFVTPEVYDLFMTRGIPQENDVFFTMEAPLGEVALVPGGVKFSIAQRILLIRPRRTLLDGRYLALALQSKPIREAIDGRATGTTVKGIASKRLKPVLLPIPPWQEQQEVVRRVEGFFALADSVESRLVEATSQVERTTQAILAKAFRGELLASQP